jgi:hypothetical protein
MARNDTSSPTDRTTPCDLCGSGTYTFASGSIWCPAERNDLPGHAGGHFVKRVAFERAPSKGDAITTREPKVRAPKPTPIKPIAAPVETFDTGFDAFVRSDK